MEGTLEALQSRYGEMPELFRTALRMHISLFRHLGRPGSVEAGQLKADVDPLIAAASEDKYFALCNTKGVLAFNNGGDCLPMTIATAALVLGDELAAKRMARVALTMEKRPQQIWHAKH